MKTISAAILIALVFSGCCSKTELFKFGCVEKCVPKRTTVIEHKYIKHNIPSVPEEPIGSAYTTVIMKINGKIWYATDRENSAIMLNNYNMYKDYSLSLRNMLLEAKKYDKE